MLIIGSIFVIGSLVSDVLSRSNHSNNIKYGFLDPKYVKNDILYDIVDETLGKLIFKMVNGGHLGFEGQK